MRRLLFYVILICNLSCNMHAPKDTTSFKTLVPDESLGQFNDLEFGIRRSRMVNLPLLYKGVDSFEVRIWNFGIWSPWQVVSLRYLENRWIVCEYTYQINSRDLVDSVGISCKTIQPAIAGAIENILTQDSILNLPSQTAIPNFKDNSADGDTYFIEIATKKFYKTLGYHNPQYYNDKYNKQFLQLLKFLELHFKFFHIYSPGS